MSTAVANVDLDALKQRLRATWMAGDYDRFSRFMESSAVEFSSLASRTTVDAEYLQVVAIRSKK